ncbi:SAF domain-containing protein [Cellulomonas soli]|uniref:SAF domain-containing protein n=1 Tax=Cellulomonas soli TaxID=931535 RepID=A0A512PGX3_9CELL|nr:SAF domain-containing protein [Cellulomonas soli]NYI59665.1 Flp pilus assembly protein CpaB [Cellulomonas soli]GEP70459.1 hypothetical protein CSO01_31740 [Cellulomonas soli]
MPSTRPDPTGRLPARLARRRPPPRARVRAVLWRARAPIAALCLALGCATALTALRPPDPVTVRTVVAAHDVAAGEPLTAADLRTVDLPRDVAVSGAPTDPQTVIGATTAVPLTAGTPLVPGTLAQSFVGPSGTVVAAVRFADAAVADYLQPGDRVDVLAATPDGGPGGTLASRALVLPDRAPARDGTDGTGILGGGTQADAGPVLLAVTPQEASALAGATGGALLSAVIVE